MSVLVYFFILDLFFGFNGKLLVLGGISIRHWLFAVILILAFVKALRCFIAKYKENRVDRIGILPFLKVELLSFSKFDKALFALLLLHGIWIIVIPYMQMDTNPDALKTAISSGMSILIMALYFPTVYLLRNRQIQWRKYRNMIIRCCISVSVLHIILYVLEKIQWQKDHTYYFMERLFSMWEVIVGGWCEVPRVVMPAYSVRIIYGFSIFVLGSFYFIVGQSGLRYILWAVLNMVALFTTGTRSLLLGVVLGICAFCFLHGVFHGWTKKRMKRIIAKASVYLAVGILLDGVLFQGMNITRLLATFSVSEEVLEKGVAQTLTWESSEYSTESEIRGTSNSNATRILDIKFLIGKFVEKPIWGHGFALGARDMQGLNYIVRIGLIGILLWIVFLGVLLQRVVNMERLQRNSALPVVYLVTALFVDVMFQAMFGSLTMAMAVFIFLDLEDAEQQVHKAIDDVR